MKTRHRHSMTKTEKVDQGQIGQVFKEKLVEVGFEAASAQVIAAEVFPEIGSGQRGTSKGKASSRRK